MMSLVEHQRVGKRMIITNLTQHRRRWQASGVTARDMVMVGDRLYTDIALGKSAGVRTVLVLSGKPNA